MGGMCGVTFAKIQRRESILFEVLEVCLYNHLSQSFAPFEVILVASTSNVGPVCVRQSTPVCFMFFRGGTYRRDLVNEEKRSNGLRFVVLDH